MPPEKLPSENPFKWLARAKNNLALAKGARDIDGVIYEDLCFECQQAAEKGLKAILISRRIPFPKTHDLSELLTLVQNAGIEYPDSIAEAAKLTGYSVAGRYPGLDEPVTQEEYHHSVIVAERVVNWALAFLNSV